MGSQRAGHNWATEWISVTKFYIFKQQFLSDLGKYLLVINAELSLFFHICIQNVEGNVSPLQYSCLENAMDKGVWWATVHGVARVGHNLVTKPPPPYSKSRVNHQNEKSKCKWCLKWDVEEREACKNRKLVLFYDLSLDVVHQGFSGGSVVKNLPAMQETEFDPWVGKISWRKAWQPTPVPLPREFHGQRSLVGLYSIVSNRARHDWSD